MKLGGIRLAQHGFPAPRLGHMFWQLFPEPVIGVQMYMLAPIGTDDWTENNLLFDETTEPPIRVCAHCQDNHGWTSEILLLMQETYILEALNHEIDIPCFVQRRMLWFSVPTSLDDDLLNDGVILEHVMKQSTRLSKVPFFCTLEDEYGKSLFHEVKTCNVGNYDRTVLQPRGRNEWLGFDGEDDEKDDDNGLDDL